MVYSFPSSKAVITSLSPATMGEESPLGAGTFHFTFFSGPNSTGGFALSAIPDPLGPRNLGHASDLSAANPSLTNTPNDINIMVSSMSSSHSVFRWQRRFRDQIPPRAHRVAFPLISAGSFDCVSYSNLLYSWFPFGCANELRLCNGPAAVSDRGRSDAIAGTSSVSAHAARVVCVVDSAVLGSARAMSWANSPNSSSGQRAYAPALAPDLTMART